MPIIEPELSYLRTRNEQLRAALETASQQQARLAAVLGTEPGDIPAMVSAHKHNTRTLADLAGWLQVAPDDESAIRRSVSDLIALRSEVVKAFGLDVVAGFAPALARRISAEVETATCRIDAARLRAVSALDLERSETEARRQIAVAEAETRTRKACADQVNAAQASIDRAIAAREADAMKLHARIAEVEKQRDASRAAHHQLVVALRDALGLPADADPGPAAVAAIRGFAQYENAARCLRALLTLSPAA